MTPKQPQIHPGMLEFASAFPNQPQHKYRIASAQPLPPGKHNIRFDLKYDGGGAGKGAIGTLFVDGQQAGQGRIERTIPTRYSLDETFDVGQETGTAVVNDHAARMPFRFTGKLDKLTVELK